MDLKEVILTKKPINETFVPKTDTLEQKTYIPRPHNPGASAQPKAPLPETGEQKTPPPPVKEE